MLDYLSDDYIKNNMFDSWYYVKKMFYSWLNDIVVNNGSVVVLDGMIKNDENDYCFGLKVCSEVGVWSLL